MLKSESYPAETATTLKFVAVSQIQSQVYMDTFAKYVWYLVFQNPNSINQILQSGVSKMRSFKLALDICHGILLPVRGGGYHQQRPTNQILQTGDRKMCLCFLQKKYDSY